MYRLQIKTQPGGLSIFLVDNDTADKTGERKHGGPHSIRTDGGKPVISLAPGDKVWLRFKNFSLSAEVTRIRLTYLTI